MERDRKLIKNKKNVNLNFTENDTNENLLSLETFEQSF